MSDADNMATYLSFSERQTEFVKAVLSGQHRQLLYGGAVAGGKSVAITGLVSLFCKIYPGSRWAIIRKDLPALRRNFIPTFEKFSPPGFFSTINQSTWSCRAANGSEVLFFPASEMTDPEHNRLRGLEINGAFVDEVNEVSEKFYHTLLTRVGRWSMPPGQPKPLPWVIMTCNPTQEWPKRLFYVPWREGTLKAPFFYLPARVVDNPFLDPEYIATLETLKDTAPHVYDMLVMGNWDIADEPDQLIRWEWVNEALKRKPIYNGHRYLGVDPARFGDDDTALAWRKGMHLSHLQGFNGIDLDRTMLFAKAAMEDGPIAAPNVRIDTIGVGAGVAAMLYMQHIRITEFVAGASPRDITRGKDQFFTFKNLRAEAWWHLRELLKNGEMSIEPNIPHKAKLIEDLITPKYSIDGEKVISVESKDKIKKRIGRSTDYGDAVVMAFAPMLGKADWLRDITKLRSQKTPA